LHGKLFLSQLSMTPSRKVNKDRVGAGMQMIMSYHYFPVLQLGKGVVLLNFPSQPSYLSLIQGPLTLLGSDSPVVPAVADPLMLPGETDEDEFKVPDGYEVDTSSLDAVESKQVNYLIIHNRDVRGTLPSIGILTSEQFYGMKPGCFWSSAAGWYCLR
jgi:hypothetical protein